MSDHLPECRRWFTNMPEPDECPACEMFRACEQRMLDAAREAVAEMVIKTVGNSAATVDQALAAIHALREVQP